ncbi:MAG: hypothetical protein SO096_07650 [Prevotella sp.]|nr:hypothetical protein [Bacteroidales bacterium]MDY4956319.1 hypothetical protein [Prevotella sp.]
MKKNKLFPFLMLPALLLATALASCDSDDQNPYDYDFNNTTAMGSWKIDSVAGSFKMKYFELDKKFKGGTLNLKQDGKYQLTNGDGSWSQTGTWKAARWYVALTVDGGAADTLMVMAPRDNNTNNWKRHLDLYKKSYLPNKNANGSAQVDKQVHVYTTKQ